ncbi:hypothetical protein MMC26_000241 [Xylographa opegraphella]|nr:hypothetical protein [Xylographa opegraphella]
MDTSDPNTVSKTSPLRTPERSPMKKRPFQITQRQKQALIDNLQLEITERARKLRAQYALQAQSLRTRVESRVNRIPKNLRTAKMGELLLKYAESNQQDAKVGAKATVKPVPTKSTEKRIANANLQAAELENNGHTRGVKRSSEIFATADKENAIDMDQPIPNPKKRSKTAATAPSRQVTNPSSVLSPKSSNSRTLPHSPIRPPFGSPQKSCLSHPVSPLKPISPSKTLSPSKTASATKTASPAKAAAVAATATLANLVGEKLAPGRAEVKGRRKPSKPVLESTTTKTRPRRGAAKIIVAESRTASSSSNYSGASTGTTVVKANTKANKKAPPVPKAGVKKGVGVSAAGKKVAAAKVEAPAAGRRVLRKRP